MTVRNANKSPKMHYFTVVWEVEKRSISTGPYRHQKLINSSTWWWASDNSNADYTGQQIFKIALLPGKKLVIMIDRFNVHTNVIFDLLDHVGNLRNTN